MNNGGMTQPKQRAAFMSMVKVTDPGNHWIWLGDVSFFGVPIFCNPRTSLTEHVYMRAFRLFKQRSVSGYEKIPKCKEDLCVNPDHFEAPRKPVAPPVEKPIPAPKTARTVPPKVKVPQRPKGLCKRGHVMSETRQFTPNGKAYCGECARIRWRATAAKKPKKDAPSGAVMKEYCIRGHKMADTRKRTPKGAAYCVVCSNYRKRKQRNAKAT